MGIYYRNKDMNTGQLRCYNCQKLLISKVSGDRYSLECVCPRCKAVIKIKVGEPIPEWADKQQIQI